jgi:hypothetical protein
MLDVHHTPEAYGMLGKESLESIVPLCSGRGKSTKCHPKGKYTKGAMKIDRGAWTWIRLLETVFSLRTLKLMWSIAWWTLKMLWNVLCYALLFLNMLWCLLLGFCGVKTYFSE